MFLFNMFERHTNWNNRDYRDYRDYRTRLKRRLRFRLSIGLALLVFLALAHYLEGMVPKHLAPMQFPTVQPGQPMLDAAALPAHGLQVHSHTPAPADTEQGQRRSQADADPDRFVPGSGR